MLILSTQVYDDIVFDFSAMTDAELLALRDKPIIHQTVDIRGDKVRNGYEAPKRVQIHRRCVYEAIQREKRSARAAGKSGAS